MPPLQDLTLGRYVPGDSLLHRMDPRAKFIAALTLMITIFAVERPIVMIALLILTGLAYRLGDVSLSSFGKNLRAFFWLYVITFVLHLFLHSGDPLWRIPVLGWAITVPGLEAAVLFTARIAVLVSLSTLLMAVTTPQDLTDGLERLFKPLQRLKVPVSEGALMVSIALRFVPLLLQEARKIQAAQKARGADLEGSWLTRLPKILPLILPLFAGALRKADNLAVALEARGYRGGAERTHLQSMKFGVRDWLGLAFSLVLAIVMLCE